MPLAFPSHQGLIAPLWRRWPQRFTCLGCCVGAAMPDVVDGIIGAARGRLGQGIGHGLFGMVALCVPAGLVVHEALAARWGRAPRRRGGWIASRTGGACSHLVFDFVSNGSFLWLNPWYVDERFFPDFWYARWLDVPLPFYAEPYPFGPHLVVWLLLSALGAWMFFRRPSA